MYQLVTREDYFESATKILSTSGPGGLKLRELCTSLHVTTGSFYGYFDGMDDFIRQYLEHWERATSYIIEIADMAGTQKERINILREMGARLPHDTEGAIRSWARSNPVVAETQLRVDERRTQAMYAALQPVLGSIDAKRLARTAMTLLAGVQSLQPPATRADYEAAFDDFKRLVSAVRRPALSPQP